MYYSIVIDSEKTTLQLCRTNDCRAVTVDNLCKAYGLSYHEFNKRFRIYFIGESQNLNLAPKKYLKYKKLDDIL